MTPGGGQELRNPESSLWNEINANKLNARKKKKKKGVNTDSRRKEEKAVKRPGLMKNENKQI